MSKYENAGHVIHHGEALEVLKAEVEEESIDLIFVDPLTILGKSSQGSTIVGHLVQHTQTGLTRG